MAKKVTANLQQSVGESPDKGPSEYETQNHLRTLIDAHEIINNPDKMKAVHKLAGRHHKAVSGIRSLQQLRAVANEKHMAKSQAPLAPMVDDEGPEST